VVISAPAERQKPLKHESVGSFAPSRSQSFNCNIGTTRSTSAFWRIARNSASSNLDYCLLGVDTFKQDGKDVIRLGFVLKILWGTEISLDGDGGFGIHIMTKHYMFKPISVQSLWTTIQSLHAICSRLRPQRKCTTDKDWVKDYSDGINSPQSCINQWNEMPDILSRRPPLPDEFAVISDEAVSSEEKKTVIRSKLRQIMKTEDLDDITSKTIRIKLEMDLNQKLEEFKSFIDEEILLIFGQMDPASKIFEFMYLGSEWNASNLEELNTNGITHIMNVTREIDNFFPASFKYLNIREYDVKETDLMKYWDQTNTFVSDCIKTGGKVLIHCKMGISRSASTVCAFAMKHFSWTLDKSLQYIKERRPIINPNEGFRHQLAVYEGILDASRKRKSFRRSNRSKSESYAQTMRNARNIVNKENNRNEDTTPGDTKEVYCYSTIAAYFKQLQDNTSSEKVTSKKGAQEFNANCKATSHPSQCTCNLEVELKVSDGDTYKHENATEAKHIEKDFSNIPIHIRQNQTWQEVLRKEQGSRNRKLTRHPLRKKTEPILSFNKKSSDLSSILPDATMGEVLSVKTLADMFDLRLSTINRVTEKSVRLDNGEERCTDC